MNSLKAKIAVITGGSKGIGKAIAFSLAKEGCSLVLAARQEEELKKTAKEISQLNGEVFVVKTDVRSAKDAQNLANKVERKFGAPDFLINNAGIGRFKEVIRMEDEDFRDTIETNLYGVFYVTRAFLPGMIEKGGGHIINMASLAGKNNFATGSAYCASKHALLSFSECLMLEVRHHNIKVTTICPGTVQTNFSAQNAKDRSWALTAEDVSDAVLDVLTTSRGSLISLVDLRPLKPQKR